MSRWLPLGFFLGLAVLLGAGVLMNACATSTNCRLELSVTRLLPALLKAIVAASAAGEAAEPEVRKNSLGALNNLLLDVPLLGVPVVAVGKHEGVQRLDLALDLSYIGFKCPDGLLLHIDLLAGARDLVGNDLFQPRLRAQHLLHRAPEIGRAHV